MIEFILTRHGETLENQRGILQGQLQGHLSPLGKEQAQELARKLEGEALDVVVSSDLARSYDTAMAVAHPRGLVPQPTALLREMDWGIYTGETLEDVDWHHLPESVESVEALFFRAGEFVHYIKREYSGMRVLAVGHGAFNRAVIVWLEGGTAVDMIDMRIMENTECMRFTLS